MLPVLAIAAAALPSVVASATGIETRDGATPAFLYDPNTTKYCSFWVDNLGDLSCLDVADTYVGSRTDFYRWNPSLAPNCGNWQSNRSYCIEARDEPKGTSTTASSSSTIMSSATSTAASATMSTIQSSITTATTSTTPTKPSNGITTPQPTQPGMVGNCNKFHHIFPGNTCDQITSYNHITQEQFARWNPNIGEKCTGLQADANACVGVIEDMPPTTTAPSNGIQTPQPTQPGMVGNCNKFHHIFPGNTCDQITSYNHITQEQFARWNPNIGLQCTGLLADANACVGVINDVPPASTTPPNGIQTPLPTQPGMVSNCAKFHYIYPGNTCGQITSYEQITQEQFARWNPQIGQQCTGMWADAYACVGVL